MLLALLVWCRVVSAFSVLLWCGFRVGVAVLVLLVWCCGVRAAGVVLWC